VTCRSCPGYAEPRRALDLAAFIDSTRGEMRKAFGPAAITSDSAWFGVSGPDIFTEWHSR